MLLVAVTDSSEINFRFTCSNQARVKFYQMSKIYLLRETNRDFNF